VPTVFDNFEKFIQVGQVSNNLVLSLWDTAGPEAYSRIRTLSYPQTNCFLIAFSVVNRSSFKNITEKWIPEISHYCSNVPYIIVGTKIDLRESCKPDQSVSQIEAEELVLNLKKNKVPVVGYMEISALHNQESVDKLFTFCLEVMIQREYNRMDLQHIKPTQSCNVQ